MKGITINKIVYKERSYIMELYTQFGRKSILVPLARQKKREKLLFCDLFNLVDFEIDHIGNILVLKDYDILNNYINIKNNIVKLNIVYIIINMLNQLYDTIYQDSFNFLESILNRINDYDNELYYLIIYLVKMMYLFGIVPRTNNCFIFDNMYLNKYYKKEYKYMLYNIYKDNNYSYINHQFDKNMVYFLLYYYESMEVLNIDCILKIMRYLNEII